MDCGREVELISLLPNLRLRLHLSDIDPSARGVACDQSRKKAHKSQCQDDNQECEPDKRVHREFLSPQARAQRRGGVSRIASSDVLAFASIALSHRTQLPRVDQKSPYTPVLPLIGEARDMARKGVSRLDATHHVREPGRLTAAGERKNRYCERASQKLAIIIHLTRVRICQRFRVVEH